MTCIKDNPEEQENMEVESMVDQNEKFSKYEKTSEPETGAYKINHFLS